MEPATGSDIITGTGGQADEAGVMKFVRVSQLAIIKLVL
jgi:hypothetical protein